MWESPINVMEIQDSFFSEIKEKTEEMVFTEIKRIGIEVDKEELIKALQYDRQQYEKGYSDGYVKAIDEFAERMSLEISESIIWGMLVNSDKDNSFNDTSDKIVDYVIDTAKKTAEEMRGAE